MDTCDIQERCTRTLHIVEWDDDSLGAFGGWRCAGHVCLHSITHRTRWIIRPLDLRHVAQYGSNLYSKSVDGIRTVG
eukprot:28940-Eustigmatos_ZCMA.PRE.1